MKLKGLRELLDTMLPNNQELLDAFEQEAWEKGDAHGYGNGFMEGEADAEERAEEAYWRGFEAGRGEADGI